MRKTVTFCLCIVMTLTCWADIKSTQAEIRFNVQSDLQAEMILNTSGLGLGTSPSANLHVAGNTFISDRLSIGQSSASANLALSGTLSYSTQTVSSNATLGDVSMVLVDSSSDNITLFLPYAGNVTGRMYQIKKIAAENSVWIHGGSNLVDDSNPIELSSSAKGSVELISNGSAWYVLKQTGLSETTAAENLISWWKLDETSGNLATNAASSNNYDGVHTGYDAATGLSSGVLGSSTNIISGRNIVINDLGTYLSGATTLSISFWMKKSNAIGSWDNPFSFGHLKFRFETGSPTTNLHIFNPGLHGTLTVSNVPNETWIFVTYTADGSTYRMYIDAVSKISGAITGGLDSSANLYLGNRYAVNDYFNGLIDDVRIYDKALTPAEVLALYGQGP